MTYFVK
jgi:hypothetical protein